MLIHLPIFFGGISNIIHIKFKNSKILQVNPESDYDAMDVVVISEDS